MVAVRLWITAGQSRILGLQGDASQAPNVDPALGWEIAGQNSPNGANHAGQIGGFGEPGIAGYGFASLPNGASPVAAFLRRITEHTGTVHAVVRTAQSNTALMHVNANSNGDWSTQGNLFGKSVSMAQTAISALLNAGHTITSIHVLWDGGSSDGFTWAQSPASLYQTEYAALVGRYRTALEAQLSGLPALKVYCIMDCGVIYPGNRFDDPVWTTLQGMQQAACDATDGMEMAWNDTVNYKVYDHYDAAAHTSDYNWYASDGIHNHQIGYNRTGYGLADFVIADLALPAASAPVIVKSKNSNTARRLKAADRILGSPQWTAPGTYTYTVPTGITSINVEGNGCGGSSGKPSNTEAIYIYAGGGGAGARGTSTLSVTPGEALTVIIGTPGSGPTASSATAGVAGGDISLKRGSTTLFLIKGGGGGAAAGATLSQGGTGGQASACIATWATDGGNGDNGKSNTLNDIGKGGDSPGTLGGTGGAGLTVNGPGNPGSNYGGGGGSPRSGNNGGGGALGILKVTYP